MTKKEYKRNLQLAKARKIKTGFWSPTIGAAEYDALQKIELGGRLLLKVIHPEDGSDAYGFFEAISKEDNDKFEEQMKAKPDYKPYVKGESRDKGPSPVKPKDDLGI